MSDENFKSDDLGVYQEENYIISSEGHRPAEIHVSPVTEEQILEKRNNIIDGAIDYAPDLKREEIALILNHYNWDLENFSNNHTPVEEPDEIKIGLKPTEKNKIKLKNFINTNYCLNCYTDKDDTFVSLNCNHMYCGECWKEYCEESIKNSDSILNIKCPMECCSCIIPEDFLTKFSDDTYKKIVEVKIIDDFINKSPNIKQCEKCKKIYHHDGPVNEFTCACGTELCVKCFKECHKPLPCDSFETWKIQENAIKDDYKQRNSIVCPMCQKYTFKKLVSNCVRCYNCKFDFCFLCKEAWKSHHICNKYCDKYDESKQTFYFNRYFNIMNQINEINTELKYKIEYIKEKLLKHYKQDEDIKFIDDALKVLIKGKKALAYSYIFAFYMKENQKDSYEHWQATLEQYLEELGKYFVDDSFTYLINADDSYFDFSFDDLKNNFQDKIFNIEKYLNNFLGNIDTYYSNELNI